jgi:hypothetical protein
MRQARYQAQEAFKASRSLLILLVTCSTSLIGNQSLAVTLEESIRHQVDHARKVAVGEAREKARRLKENYRGWKNALDNCPCTIQEMKSAPYSSRFELSNSPTSEIYHPGASYDYRTSASRVRPFPASSSKNLDPLMPGQQCIYDINGNLITKGPGAGTPDAYSPNVTFPLQGTFAGALFVGGRSHTYWDESTFDPNGMRYGKTGLTWPEYQKTWTPNNGNKCMDNPSGGYISVEVFEKQTPGSFGLWDMGPGITASIRKEVVDWRFVFRSTVSPDIKVCINNKCMSKACKDSYLCFVANLPLKRDQRVYIELSDEDILFDDPIGSGSCVVNGKPCRIGNAEVILSPE